MKIQDLKNIKNIEKDDILGALGLQSRQSTLSSVVSSLSVFGAGILVGAGVALLLAPKSGREMREDINQRLRKTAAPGDGQALDATAP